MGNDALTVQTLDDRIAGRLKALRVERGWSLDDLSRRCGISRASLSRLENADVSPTATMLGKLASSYGLSISRLMAMAETDFVPLVTAGEQTGWEDPETGFLRQSVSPPAHALAGELVKCALPAGQRIEYPVTPRAGLEHHLYMLDGMLDLTVNGTTYRLRQGDCLRYQLYGPSVFETGRDHSAGYLLAIL